MTDPGQAEPFPVAQGQQELDTLARAGFNPADLARYRDEQTQALMQGGFHPDEIAKHWGYPADKNKAVDEHVRNNLSNLTHEEQQEITSDPIKLLEAGFQSSFLGLSSRAKPPSIAMAPETGHLGKIAQAAGQMAGDLPAMVLGGIAGGGVAAAATAETGPGAVVGGLVGAGAGAAMLPEALRQIMIDSMRAGEVHSSREFLEMAGRSVWETAKAGIAGGVGGLSGGVAGKLAAPLVGETAAGAANAAANVAAFSATAAGLEGRMVTAGDFVDGAFLALATHTATRALAAKGLGPDRTEGRVEPTMSEDSFSKAMDHIQQNLENLYVSTGQHPMEIVSAAKDDQVLMDELLGQTAGGLTLAPNITGLVPPEPPPAVGLTMKQAANIPEGRPGAEYRINSRGMVIKTQNDIQGYLKQIGEKMGFSIQTGPPLTSGNDANEAGPFFVASFHREGDGTIVTRGKVWVTDQEEQYRNWFGLNKTEVLWHEIGHAIDARVISGKGTYEANPDTYGRTAQKHQPPEIKAEMEMASRNFKPKLWGIQAEYNGQPNELMADAIAVWISDPTAAARMPEFTKKFSKVLEPMKALADKAVPARIPNEEWTTDEQWKEKVKERNERAGTVPPNGDAGSGGLGGGRRPPPPPGPASVPGDGTPPPKTLRIEGEARPVMSEEHLNEIFNEHVGELPNSKSFNLDPDTLYRQNVSELGPARNIDKALHNPEKGFNREEDVGMEDMFRQTYASGQRASYFIHQGTLDPTNPQDIKFNKEGPSIKKAFQQAQKDGGTRDGFRNYLLALRTIGRWQRGQETGLDVDRSILLAQYGVSKYANAAKIWNDTQRAVLEYARIRGSFSQEQVDAITNSDSFAYITMRRVLGNDAGMRGTSGRNFRARNPLMKMEGSNKQIVDPIAASVDNIRNIVAMADRNAAIKTVVDLVERGGLNDLPGLGIKQLPTPEVKATIAAAGSDHFDPYLSQDIKEAVKPFLAARGVRGKDSTKFVYFREGKPEVWTATDPYLAQLFRGADSPGEAHFILRGANFVASLTRAGITSALDFGTRMALRDQIGAFALDPSHPPPFVGLVKGAMEMFKGGDAYHSWIANGGAGTAITALDVNYLARDLHGIFEKTGTFDRMWNTVRHPLEAMQILNERLDAAPRVGNMQRLVAQGKTPLKAATMSRQAFLDFAEKGTSEFLNQWQRATPFMRPGFLGLNQAAMAVKNHPVQTALYSTMAVMGPTMMLYALNYLMDEYGGLPEDQKYRNQDRVIRDTTWMLPPIKGLRIKLATPPELGFLMKALPERMLDHWLQNDKHALDNWAQDLVSSLAPPFIPSIVKPVLEDRTNHSTNTGRALIPASMEKASGDMQYTENTTETAKAVSRVLGPISQRNLGFKTMDVSPIVIDNYVRQWTGTTGFAIMKAVSAPFKTGGKPWEFSDVPGVQGFVARHPDMNAQPIQDFYNDKKEMDTLMHNQQLAKKRMKQGGDTEEFENAMGQSFFRSERAAQALNTMHNSILTLQNDPTMKDFERRQFIEQIYSQMIEVSRGSSQAIQAFKEGMKQ